MCPLPAEATVYEFGPDGAILSHEAYDYRSARGAGQSEILQPSLIPAVPFKASVSSGYEHFIRKAATDYGLSADLIRAVIRVESAGKYDALSPKGAQGLMQLMPTTARQYGVTNPFDPAQNIYGGSKYLSYLLNRYNGDTKLALAAYNAGEGTVDRYKGIPPYPETIQYVRKVERALK
ncbi:MAG: lytic transglycosylase domain-containing protein [Alphaproteobacteria bacterium]|nr:lytic transglycosylase domain-containing protein [Alphaproteobacteria bacterium]